MQKMEKVILKSLLKETTLVKYLKGIENHQLNVELPSGKVHFRKLEFNTEVCTFVVVFLVVQFYNLPRSIIHSGNQQVIGRKWMDCKQWFGG
jgi:hypothetical protein